LFTSNRSQTFPGIVIAGAILIFMLAAMSALLLYSPEASFSAIWLDPYYRHVTAFSFYQALLSTLLSVGLAIPVAHALSRRHFRGKALLLKLCATTLVLPVLVGVLGIISIYGNSGLLSQVLAYFGYQLPFSIYGLNGILLAHVFFNLPFATRLLLQSLQTIPAEQHKLATHLGIFHWHKFKLLEWPSMRQQLPNVAGLVFMLCFTSFATVMALGGGPKSTTIELAIYQAIKFDFDLQSGALMALWQMILCTGIAICMQRFSRPLPIMNSSTRQANHFLSDSALARFWDWLWISAIILLILPPLLMVIIGGVNTQLLVILIESDFWRALSHSLLIALSAALLTLVAGIFILISSRFWRLRGLDFRADKLELVASIILVTPGIVISTGLFLLLREISNVFSFAWLVVILVNALMALPYVLKTLSQPMLHMAQQYDKLSLSLGLFHWHRFKLIEWRGIKQPIVHAFIISFVLSLGDLSAIALFGSQDFMTLPLYLLQLLASYQMSAAAVIALILLILSVGTFTLIEKLTLKSNLEN
jgi:thiamine transport system permease protein